MTTEKDRMLRGELYSPLDQALTAERSAAQGLLRLYNGTFEEENQARRDLLTELLGKAGDGLTIQPPFQCDYGKNIHVGDACFINFNCIILDVCRVHIGNHVLLGPGVHIYTATHPLDYRLRRDKESGEQVSIGDDVWIGGGAIICPGVTIGPRTVIGAGSVVTHDIPADVLAAGNPCRIIRPLATDEPVRC